MSESGRHVERGAEIRRINSDGGYALGVAIHGSANCFDTRGGPGVRLPDEAVNGNDVQIVEYLIIRGIELPDHINGGSDIVQDVLSHHGAPDAI